MAARSLGFKAISLLVIFVLASANFSVVFAQDGATATPTQTPPAGSVTPTPEPAVQATATATPAAPTPLPPTQVEASPTPAAAATETPPPQAPVGLPTEMPVQASFSISGTVTGADGQSLPGVAVSDDKGHQVQTAADGSYSLEGLAPGDYAVRPGQGQVTLIPTLRVVHVVDKNVSGVDFYPPKAPLPVNAAAQPMPTNYQHVLAAGLPASQGDLSAQSVYTVGQPGTSYTYLPTNQIGTTGEPYELQSVGAITQLNAPSALALDASGKLVEVEEHGNRLVRFNGPVSDLEIGNKPGIAYMDNYVFNSLTAVAVNPANGHYWVGDSTRLVEYDPSLSVGQRFISQMPSTNPWESGSDPNHFTEIRGIAFNTAGPEMYVSDRFNHRIQMYDISGSYPSYTGTIGVTGAAGSDNAHFNEPWGITFYNNYLYVADSMNHRIQKCDPIAFTCVTYLGGAAPLPGSQQIYLKRPTAISFNATYAFIADAQNEIVARCNLSGAMACTLFAGTAGETGVDGSHLNWPLDVVASATLVYVADQNNQRILLFNPSTAVFISTIGTTSLPFVTDDTHLDRPWGLAIDTKDNNSLYVGENWGYSLAKFDSDGDLIWRVPANPGTFGSDLHHFGNFQGGNQGNLAVDGSHRIYVPDAGNNRVMIYKSDGSLFGQLGSTWGSDNAHLACPQGVAVGTDGKIYVADTCNQRVQVFDASLNYVTTIGVTGQTGTDGSHFNQPAAVSIDNNTGNLFVADQANDRVQKCHPTTSTSYACTPFAGSTGVSGNVNFRYLNSPSSVLVDPVYKRVIVADDQASRVQVFDMNGAYLTTLGGEWGEAGGRMRDPSGLAVDSNGDLFVADRENARVQVYLPYETFWTQLNVNGFGEQFNGRVDGLAYFTVPYKGSPTSMLYVTTVRDDGNPPTPGAAASSPQVWRMLPDYTWQAVSAPGFGDSANTALVDLAAYNGDLYAGTFNVSGAQIWRCPNANPATPTNPCAQQSDWTQVTMPWGQPSPQFSIADRMMEFKPDGNTDLLAVSMMNYYSSSGVYTTSGGEVWLYNGSTDAWLNYPLTLDATHAGTALVGVQSMTAFNGTLVAGTNDWVHSPPVPAQLWVCTWTSGNCAWGSSPKRDFSSINTNVTAITSLLVVGTNLYVGTTGANNTGASIYCYFNAWSDSMTIMTGGFGDPNNSAINAMAYQSSSLFAVTSNAQTGLNIYSSNNGLNWGAYLEYPGFGNATNTQVDLDSSVTFDPSGRMLVGTWNTANGGALWASKVSHYQISGVVTTPGNPPTGLDGVKMTLQPGNLQQTTSGGGNYTFSNLLPGSYTITPSLAAYAFTPPNQVVNLTNASVSNINFSGASGAITLQAPANGTQFASLDPVTLQWVSNGAATKYTLEVSTALSFTPLFKNVTVTGLTYALSGLKSNTTYYWQVRQAVPTPVGTWSAPWSFTTPVPPAAPVLLTPANGAALPAGDFIPIFTWKAAVVPAGSAPVQHYHIQASKQSTFTSLDIDEYTLDASTTFTTLFNLTGNRTYYWRVRAFNSVGDYGPWSSVRTLKILPDKVASAWMYEALESPNYSLTLQPGFHWTDPACTGKYLIQIYKSIPSHPLVKSATVTTGTVCEGDYLLTTSLGLNTLYEWRISVQGVTGTSLPVINTFTTPGVVPGTPVLLGPANNEAIPDATYPNWQPNFTWQQVTSGSPEGYEIQIASQPGFGSSILIDKQIHNATNHNYQLGDALAYNASVYWRVRACQESCSVWSAARKLVTRPGTPTNLNETGYHNGEGTATLDTIFQWSDPGTYPNSAKSYSLAIYSNTACTTLWKTLTSTTTSVDVLLNPGVNYCVKVRGVGPTASITGAYSAPGTFTSMSPPAVPTLLLPANKAVISSSVGGSEPYQVNFSWKASPPPVPGATVSYYLQVSDKPDFTSNWVNDSGVPGPSSTKSFHAGTYYWRVSAWDSVGSYAYSMWSAARSFSTPAQINVRVTTEGNGPLANASVAVSGVSTPATTDSNGNCYIANVSSGAHTITVSLANRMTQTRTVTIANGKVYFEPFALPPVSLTLGVIRVVLTWDPDNGRSLEGNLWLPLIPTPFHLVYPNTGKNDLNSFPNAYESVYQPADGIEAIDLMPVAGNYVFGVNQVVPASGSWSGAGAKVEVYRSTGASLTLLKTCLQPSGSGRWWYAANMTLWGAIPSVTCMNSLRAAAPAPYNDNPITGHVYANLSRHPLSGVWISYDTGAAITDQNGFYSIPASAGASYTLTPETYGVLSFSPTNSAAAAGATGVDFTATPAASLSPGRLYAEAIQGDYAYLGANGWLYIVNIHNKAGPVEASRLWIDGTNIQDIVVAGHYAYLASASETGGEVNVVDVSNPANPVWVSSEPVLADNLAVYGQYLVMASSRYLYIYQQATSPAPHFLTRLVTLDPGSVNAAYWVAVSGHYAYVTGSQGLYIYDITNPAHPSAPWHYPAFWGYYTLVVDGQYAYLGYDDGDMLILDVADPAHVYQVSMPVTDSVRLAKAGNYLYAVQPSSEKKLIIVDVSNPYIPTQPGSYAFTGTTVDVQVQENYAFVLEQISGSSPTSHLDILDVSDKATPVEVGSYTPAP